MDILEKDKLDSSATVKRERFVNFIIKWGKYNLRFFPWRNPKRTPYEVLVAELLLQRTRAEQVIPIYEKLIMIYPNFSDLANAVITDLQNMLSPLGLYRQKTNSLIQIGQILTSQYNQTLPCEEAKLVELPGVGIYTARATLCFGFGKRVSILDVNVSRLLMRYFGFEGEKRKDLRRFPEIIKLAEELVPVENFKLYNYALLDFPAKICLLTKPLCDQCGLQDFCTSTIHKLNP